MKYLYFIFLLFLISCQPFRPMELRNEPGRCYKIEIEIHGKMEPPRLLRLKAPKFITIKKRLSDSLIADYQKLDDDAIIWVITRESYLKFDFVRDRRSDGWGGERIVYSDEEFFYCLYHTEPVEHRFTKKELARNDYTYSFEKLKRATTIEFKIVKHLPKKLKSNQRYMKAGKWGEIKGYLSPGGGSWGFTIREVEQALVDRGYYRIIVDGHMDMKERLYLFDFQRKNGLMSGRISPETLKFLGFARFAD